MKKSQFLIAALCASALVLSSCAMGGRGRGGRGHGRGSSDQPSSSEAGTSEVSSSQAGTSQGGTSEAGTSQGGTSEAGTSQAGTSQAGTSEAGTSQGGTSHAGTSEAGTSQGGTSHAGTSEAGTSQGGTSHAGTSEAGTSQGGTSSSSGATSSTSGVDPVPTAWSEDEKALLEGYVHTDEIPFLYVEGSVLERERDYACLSYYGGESSAELLEEYASMFDSSWNIRATRGLEVDQYGLVYFGEKEIDFGGDPVTVSVSLYGYDFDEGEVTADGSGVFYLEFSDGLFYGWDEFAGTYQEVLDYIYDQYDENNQQIAFPNSIALIQDPSYEFVIEPENQLAESGYYLAWVYGLTGEDMELFMEAFDESEHWEPYIDTVEGLPAYHDDTGSIAIDYFDATDYGYAAFLIHAYEPIYYDWPGDDIQSFIKSNNASTDVVIPSINSNSYVYEAEGNEMVIYLFDDALKSNDIDDYVAGLDSDVWTVEKITDPTYGDYYVCFSYDWAITMQAFYISSNNSGYGVIVFDVNEPLAEAFPSAVVDAMFSAYSVEVPETPVYEIAGDHAGFEISVGSHSVDTYIFGSNTIELSEFMKSLDAGWVLDPEQTKEGISVYVYGESLARLTIADRSKVAGAHFIYVGFDVALDWSDEQKAQFETTLHGVILPYFSVELTYTNSEEEGEYFSFLGYENENFTPELMEAYYAFTGDPTWSQDEDYISFSKPTDDGGSVEAFLSNDGNFYIYYADPAQTDWVEEDYEYIDYCLGGIVPVFFEGSYSEIMAAWFGVFMSNNEFTQAEFDAYVEASVAAGWEKVEQPLQVTLYQKWAEDESGYASFFYDMFGYIEFEYVQVDWKADDKAAFIEKLHGIVPPYLEGGLWEQTTHDFEGYAVYDTVDELISYLDEALDGDGWTKDGSGVNTTYSKASSDGEGSAVFSLIYEYDEEYEVGYYYWVIDFVANAA